METIFKGYTVQTFIRTLDADGTPNSDWVCTDKYPSASGRGLKSPYVYSSEAILKGIYKLNRYKKEDDCWTRRQPIRDTSITLQLREIDMDNDREKYLETYKRYSESCVGYSETKLVIREAHIVLQ